MEQSGEHAVTAAIAAETRLLEPDVRASPELAAELLDSDFHEIGASGRHWDTESILAMMSSGSDAVGGGPAVEVSGMTGVLLAPGLVHLTYRLDRAGRRTLRSSLWRWSEAGWRMYFHQGTPAPEG